MCNKNSACAKTAHVKKRFSVVKRYTDNVQLFFFLVKNRYEIKKRRGERKHLPLCFLSLCRLL